MNVSLSKALDEYETEDDIMRELSVSLQKSDAYHETTVRNFIWWFGAYRRGPIIVSRIRAGLDRYGLSVTPDFETTYVDNKVRVTRRINQEDPSTSPANTAQFDNDPIFRVAQLESANRPLVFVNPNDSLARAVSLMLAHDYSQLPVLNNSRSIMGAISWKSIGSKLSLLGTGHSVSEFTTSCTVVDHDRPIFEVYDLIDRDDFVIVRAKDRVFSGIITTSDLSNEFRRISEAFVVLGEIERNIRRLLERWNKLTSDDICSICNIKVFDGFHQLTFGAYIRIISDERFWSAIPVRLDRSVFSSQMDSVRMVRNSVMHFNPDPTTDKELLQLKNFSSWLQKLVDLKV